MAIDKTCFFTVWAESWGRTTKTINKVCAHWTAHMELRGGLTILDMGSWL